jgi:hypothetical protein
MADKNSGAKVSLLKQLASAASSETPAIKDAIGFPIVPRHVATGSLPCRFPSGWCSHRIVLLS